MAEPRRFGYAQRGARHFALGVAFAVICVACPRSSLAGQSAQSHSSAANIFPLSTLWMVMLDTPPAFAPAYDDDRVYIALKADEEKGHPVKRVTAYSLTDGSRKWARDAAEVEMLETGDGLLFASSGARIEALLPADGTPGWEISLDAPLAAPLLAEGGWLIALTQASHAYAIRASDGRQIWDVHLPSPASGQPALLGDGVYLPLSDNRVLRLNLETGAIVWDRSLLSRPACILPLEDRLFVGTNERWFYALAPQTGRVDWRFRVGGAVAGTPAADRSTVYFLAFDNLLRALDRSGGVLKWRQLLPRRGRFGPFSLGALLVVSGWSPVIQTYSINGGVSVGTFEAPHDLFSPVHVIPGLVDRDFLLVAVTGEGELLAIRPHSLEPEKFALSPRVALMAGFPYWIW